MLPMRDGRDGQQVKIELLSFWSVNRWVSQCSFQDSLLAFVPLGWWLITAPPRNPRTAFDWWNNSETLLVIVICLFPGPVNHQCRPILKQNLKCRINHNFSEQGVCIMEGFLIFLVAYRCLGIKYEDIPGKYTVLSWVVQFWELSGDWLQINLQLTL